MDDEHLNVWPSIADMLTSIVLITFIFLIIIIQNFLPREEAKDCTTKLKDCESSKGEIENSLADTKNQIAEKEKIIGIPEKFIQDLMEAVQDLNPHKTDYGTLEISSDLFFEFDREKIPGNKREKAVKLGRSLINLLLTRYDKNVAMIQIIGYTDSVGEWDYNLNLSLMRAKSLMRLWGKELPPEQLRENMCISSKIITSGFGESRPVVSGNKVEDCENDSRSDKGCKKNRRIEIRILPKSENTIEIQGCN